MGGHGHGHKPPYVVPSPDIYKVEDVPQLMKVQEKLAKKGLKDPWLRNEVWRYTTLPGTKYTRGLKILTRGLTFGIPLFILDVSLEEYFLGESKDVHGHGGHH